MKIEVPSMAVEKIEVVLPNKDSPRSPQHLPTESSNSSDDAVSTLGDAVSSISVRDDLTEHQILPIDMNNYLTQTLVYSGCPSPVPGFLPYHLDALQYQNPVMDYSFVSQPYCVPISSAMQYPSHSVNGGYLYSPQSYQYAAPPAYYFQSAPAANQYLPPNPTIPGGGMVIMETQDPLMPGSGYVSVNSYVPTIPSCPLTIAPLPVFNDSVSPYPSYTLRAAATPFAEPTGKPKSWQKLASIPEVVPSSSVKSDQPKSSEKSRSNLPVVTQVTSEQSRDTWAVKARGHGQKVTTDSHVTTIAARLPQQPNMPDFSTSYEDAKFFVIKSYSEDNVRRSIQHGVWASTPNGNKKLDDAFREACTRAKNGKPGGGGCPVFLFFSVNGSRQFCGVAEMLGLVDYHKTMEFWEQHKWSGSFPVKWHIVKDLPNSLFRRIILENNENKPVTNSRDTQEVNFQQGIEMLRICKNYPLKTSMLTNLDLYSPAAPPEDRQERKFQNPFPQLPQKVSELSLKEKSRSEALKAPPNSNTTVNGVKNFNTQVEVLPPQDDVKQPVRELNELQKAGNFSGQNEVNCPERSSLTSFKGGNKPQIYQEVKSDKAILKQNSRKENSMDHPAALAN